MIFKEISWLFLFGDDFVSATIGAALKKIAVALLTDKKVIKTIGGIAIGIIIIVVMPIVAVVSVFNGSMDIDTDKLNQSIQENISAEQMENLQLINDTMTEVENQLKNKKLSDYNTQAEVIYLFSLSDKSEDEDFVKNFVSCFKKNQSDEDLIKTVNQKFGTEIKYDEFQKMMQSIKGAEISTAGFTDKTTKNNLDLVKWCENAYKNGWGYVYGGYGQVCTKQYLDQQASLFPGNNEAGGEMRKVGEKWLGKRVCDCIGLIKSYAWYNSDSGEIVAGSKRVYGLRCKFYLEQCYRKRSDFKYAGNTRACCLDGRSHRCVYRKRRSYRSTRHSLRSCQNSALRSRLDKVAENTQYQICKSKQ